MKRLLTILFLLSSIYAKAATYGAPFVVSTVSSLTNRPNPSALNPAAIVLGYSSVADGRGGVFYYDPASAAAVDNDIYFPATTAGRWIRLTRQINTVSSPLNLTNGILTSSGGGSGAGTNAFVNGVLVQPLYITNSTSVLIYTNGNGHITFNVNDYDGFWSDLTNALVAGSNVSFSYTTNKLTISATAGGATNATVVTVDGGADQTRINIADSTGILATLVGTNASFALADRDFGDFTTSSSGTVATIDNSAVTTAKIADGNVTTVKIADSNVTTAKIADSNVTTVKIADSNVTTAKIADANVTQAKLGTTGTGTSTNFLAGDYSYKQVTTNMIPGLNAILATIGSGGGSLAVNGTNVTTPNLLNTTNGSWAITSSSNISYIPAAAAGGTTDNVLQWVGSAYFVITNNSTTGDFSTLSTNGIIYSATCVDCQNDSPAIVEFSFPSRATNYVWTFMPEGNVNGYVAYEAEGYRGATSLRIKIHEAAGSTFFTGGYWMRFDMWAKTSVGGSGSGSVSVNSTNVSSPNLSNNWNLRQAIGSSTNITFIPPAVQSTTTSSWTPDFSAGRVHQATMNGNLTLNAPSNVSSDMVGSTFLLVLVQDSTGGRSVTPATNYLFGNEITSMSVTTNAGSRNYINVFVRSTSVFDVLGNLTGYSK